MPQRATCRVPRHREESSHPLALTRVSSAGRWWIMRPTNDAIEHCRSHIERTRTALERREALGRDTYDLRRRLKTLEALLAVHKAARDTVPPRPSSKPLR